MLDVLAVILFCCFWLAQVWMVLSLFLDIVRVVKAATYARYRRLRRMWAILKYPALVGCFSLPALSVLAGEAVHPLHWFLTGIMSIAWWVDRNDHNDDDFTKKLKKKVKEFVQRVGSKLIVVPEPT